MAPPPKALIDRVNKYHGRGPVVPSSKIKGVHISAVGRGPSSVLFSLGNLPPFTNLLHYS